MRKQTQDKENKKTLVGMVGGKTKINRTYIIRSDIDGCQHTSEELKPERSRKGVVEYCNNISANQTTEIPR